MFSERIFLNPFALGPLMTGFVIVYDALGFLVLCTLLNVVISWARAFGANVPRYNKVLMFVERVGEFATAPIRRLLPSPRMGQMCFDFSPLIALVALNIVQGLVLKLGHALLP
jgi:uncharacterized protein YggT (Ycf19 family)